MINDRSAQQREHKPTHAGVKQLQCLVEVVDLCHQRYDNEDHDEVDEPVSGELPERVSNGDQLYTTPQAKG